MNILQLLCLIFGLRKIDSFNLIETATFIARSEFQQRTTTSVVWLQTDVDQVTDFLINYQGCVETIDMNENQNKSVPLQQAILFVTYPNEFFQFVENMDTSIKYPSKVITVVMKSNINLSNITEFAWKHDLSDLIILTQDEDQSVVMHTYYPYSNNECGNTAPIKVEYKEDFFPRKFKNFLGCETRVGSSLYPPYTIVKCSNDSSPFIGGFYGKLLMMIAEHLNTTVKVKCLPLSLITDEALVPYIKDKRYHIFIPLYLKNIFLASLQNTPVFQLAVSGWCGPPRREIYAWAKVLVPMMNNVTIFLGATYVALVITLKIIKKIERTENKNSHIAWKAFAIILGQDGMTDSKSERSNFLSALWLWSCLVITTCYQGELVKGMQTKYLEPPFDTIENAINLVDGHGGLQTSLLLLYNGTPIGDRWQTIRLHNLFSYMEPISKGKRFLILFSKMGTLGYNIQFLEPGVLYVPMSAGMTPRWGGSLEISSSIIRLVEAGFFQKLVRDKELSVERKQAMMNINSITEFKAGHLKFVTLSTCFFGLGVMGLVCFVVLLLEIFHYWLMTHYLNERHASKME